MRKKLRVLMNCAGVAALGLIWSGWGINATAEDKNSVFARPPEEFKKLRPAPKLLPPAAERPLPSVAPIPLIDEIEGAGQVLVQGPQGSRNVKSGEAVDVGEVVQTGADVSAKILFADGSQVLMGSGAEVGIERPVGESGEPAQISAIYLKKGEARILIENDSQRKSNYRFLTRTKSVVMGVRGTDFIVSASDDQTSVHTISGVVDVASDYTAFKGRKVTALAAAQAVEVLRGRAIQPKAFALDPFIKQFHARHGRLEGIWTRASLDLKNKKYRNMKFPTGVPRKRSRPAISESRSRLKPVPSGTRVPAPLRSVVKKSDSKKHKKERLGRRQR